MQENMKTIPESAEGMEYLVDLGRERTKIRTVVIDGHTYTVDNLRRVEAIASIGAWLQDRLQAAPGCVVIA